MLEDFLEQSLFAVFIIAFVWFILMAADRLFEPNYPLEGTHPMTDLNTPAAAIVICEERGPFPNYRAIPISSLERLWVSLAELRKDNWIKPEALRVWVKIDPNCAQK